MRIHDISPMARLGVGLFCFYSMQLEVFCQNVCGQKLPEGSKVFTEDDCDRRYRELNTEPANYTSWAQYVEQLHVQPVGIVTRQTSTLSLAISWILPRCLTYPIKGIKFSVTALDDGSQHSVSHLLDLTSVSSRAFNSSECGMTHHVPVLPLKTNYNWNVRVESVPSAVGTAAWIHSVLSVMVETDDLLTAGSSDCGTIIVTYIVGPNSVSVTVCGDDVSKRNLAFDVILYKCSKCCPYCQMTKEKQGNVVFPNTTAEFVNIDPGSYSVWIHLAGSVDHVCASIGVLHFTHLASSSPAISTTTTVAAAHNLSVNTQWEDTAQPASSAGHGSRTSPVVVVTGCVAAVAVISLMAVMVVICRRRRRGQSQSRGFVKGLPCLEKLTSQPPAQSTGSHEAPSEPNRPNGMSALPTRAPSSSAVAVFLLSHSIPHHPHSLVTDSLALYLQAFCACDVVYSRWQMDDIRCVGPEKWALDQLFHCDCVVFVHSHETRNCYEAWKLGVLRDKEKNVEVRILTAVFGHFTSKPTSCKWFDVTFCSDLFNFEDDHFEFVLPLPVIRRSQGKTRTTSLSKAEADSASQSSANNRSSDRCFYLLMNDFTQLLADLHNLPNLPNLPRVFMDRGLPLDSQHLDTAEGRHLYKAVAVLNGDPRGCSSPDSASEGRCQGAQKMDSGFQDVNLTFFAPEELSAVGSETTLSLREKFHAINAGYEMARAGDTTSVFHSECYSLGGRYV